MKTRTFAFLAVLLAPLFFAACSQVSQRTLDPIGAYQGDRILFELDGVIAETAAVFDQVIAWADRNAAYVSAHDNISKQVAKIRAEMDGRPQPGETLTRLFAVRDAYRLSSGRDQAHADAVRREIALARTAIDTARLLLTTATP